MNPRYEDLKEYEREGMEIIQMRQGIKHPAHIIYEWLAGPFRREGDAKEAERKMGEKG